MERRGIKKHLPSLLESRAVITKLRRSKRGGGKEQRYRLDESCTQRALRKERTRMRNTHQRSGDPIKLALLQTSVVDVQ